MEWGDAGDEATSPSDTMPPRAQSRNPPTVHEDAVLDESEFAHSHETPERRGSKSNSRSRSSRSRSRTAAYHPYNRDAHSTSPPSPPAHDPPQPSFAGLSSAIMRSISSSSSSGSCVSPVDSALVVTPSVSTRSIERGRAARPHPPSSYRSPSRSGSPPSAPLTPLDVSAAYRARGRKPSPRTVRASPSVGMREPSSAGGSGSGGLDEDKLELPPRWTSPNSAGEPGSAASRSASYDLTRGRGAAPQRDIDNMWLGQAARSESMPPPLGVSWSLQAFKTAAVPETSPVIASGMSSRSRSVVDSGRASQNRGRRV